MPTTRAASRLGDLDDFALVRRTRAGDALAYGELVERHRRTVVRVAARIVGPDEAEDVAQDALLRAYHRIDLYRGEAPFRAWLLRITHRAALDALARRRSQPTDDPEGDGKLMHQSAPRSPADALEDHERRDRLAEKIRRMKPQHRSVLMLRDVEGLTYEEVSFVAEMPVGSVKGRLHRARAELIDALRNNAYDWDLPE